MEGRRKGKEDRKEKRRVGSDEGGRAWAEFWWAEGGEKGEDEIVEFENYLNEC